MCIALTSPTLWVEHNIVIALQSTSLSAPALMLPYSANCEPYQQNHPYNVQPIHTHLVDLAVVLCTYIVVWSRMFC